MENGFPERYIIFPRVERTIERIKNIAGGIGWIVFNHLLYEGKSDHHRTPGESTKAFHQAEYARQRTLPVGDLEDDGGYWDRFNLEADVNRQLHETEVIDGKTI